MHLEFEGRFKQHAVCTVSVTTHRQEHMQAVVDSSELCCHRYHFNCRVALLAVHMRVPVINMES